MNFHFQHWLENPVTKELFSEIKNLQWYVKKTPNWPTNQNSFWVTDKWKNLFLYFIYVPLGVSMLVWWSRAAVESWSKCKSPEHPHLVGICFLLHRDAHSAISSPPVPSVCFAVWFWCASAQFLLETAEPELVWMKPNDLQSIMETWEFE